MEKQIGKIERKKRGFGFGSFFFGTFIGFLLCILTIVGLALFIYNNVSAQWLKNSFNVEIDLGSEELNDKTLKDIVVSASGLLNNTDTYTINNLESDFGVEIGDKLMGLDITDLKAVPIKDIADEAQNKFKNISAEELKDVMNLSDMKNILEKTNTYYVSEDKLYKTFDGINYSNKVEFEYSINNGVVTVKKQTFDVSSGEVKINLKYLPLTVALGDFMDTMGDKITLGELESDYGVTLPSYFDNIDKTTRINELEDEINDLYLADFMGYTIDADNNVYDGQTEIKGIMAIVAKKTVGDLDKIEKTVNETTIAEILDINIKKDATGYYDDVNDNNVRDDGEESSSYIMDQIAGQQVQQLSSFISGLKLSQIFEDRSTGILSLISGDPTVDEIPNAVQSVITNTAVGVLIQKGIVSEPSSYSKYSEDVTTVQDETTGDYKTVAELTLPELLEYCFDKLDELEELENQIA